MHQIDVVRVGVEQQAKADAENQFWCYTIKLVAIVFHGQPVASKGVQNSAAGSAYTNILGRRRRRILHNR